MIFLNGEVKVYLIKTINSIDDTVYFDVEAGSLGAFEHIATEIHCFLQKITIDPITAERFRKELRKAYRLKDPYLLSNTWNDMGCGLDFILIWKTYPLNFKPSKLFSCPI